VLLGLILVELATMPDLSAAVPLRKGHRHHCSDGWCLTSAGDPKSRPAFGRIGFPAEVAQLVEQWSEEPPPRGFQRLLDNSRLIPIFGVKEQWFQ